MKRIQPLDGVRGVAILLVIVWHYIQNQIVPEPYSLAAYVKKMLSLTWSGVDLFFVLSGFLIVGILLDHRDASNYFHVFYIRRICRIFPLYFLLLGLFVLLPPVLSLPEPAHTWLFSNPHPLWSYATFTQNILMGIRGEYGPNWLGISWSLAVEEQFYLFIPLLVFFFRRRMVVYIFLAAILLAPLLRIGFPGFHAFINTPWRADSLLSGGCLAVLVRSPEVISLIGRYKRYLYVVFVMLLVGAAVMTLHPEGFGRLNHSWLAGLYSVFVLLAATDANGLIGRALSNKVLVWFGTLSYGIYMFHQAVSGLVHGLLRNDTPSMRSLSDAGVTALAFLITLSLAYVSYKCFEKPILQIGHRTRYLHAAKTVTADGKAVVEK